MNIIQILDELKMNVENNLAALLPFQRNKPIPNSHKAQIIKNLQIKSKCGIFLETGTFKGEMINSLKAYFPRLISIELDGTLFQNAKKIFLGAGNIEIVQGDSGIILDKIIAPLDDHVFYWLDAHCDGAGTNTARGVLYSPITRELKAIAEHSKKIDKKPIIMIDDADCFNGQNDYPSIDRLYQLISGYFPAHKIKNLHNIIEITY